MPEILPIFPTAIYKNFLRALTLQELNYINSVPTFKQELGNMTSNNSYILDSLELIDLKNKLMEQVHVYAREIMKIDNEFYMTNSWLNVTKKSQNHSLHTHTNSIISGVYYIDVNNSQPSISFNRPTPPFLLNLKAKSFTPFNTEHWSVPVENHTVLLFPSQMYHGVTPNFSNNDRISIAFNTFVKGQIGDTTSGADLYLN
jgi:uncharacterized protein (TIGR02466 family)